MGAVKDIAFGIDAGCADADSIHCRGLDPFQVAVCFVVSEDAKAFPVGCGASQEVGPETKLPTYTKVLESDFAATKASDGLKRDGNIAAAVRRR